MMKKEDVLAIAKADLKAAEPMRKDQDDKVKQWRAEYNGEPYGNEKDGKSKIVSRDIKKQAEWQHAGLIDPFVSNPDIIKANPITFEDKDAAIQNELVLNTQFCRQFDRYTFMTKAVKVLDKEGTCMIMTGWEYEEETKEVEVPVIGPDPMTGMPTIVGMEMQEEIVVTKNQPTAKVIRSEDVYIDPTCQDNTDEAQFFIYRYESDLRALNTEAKAKNYKNLDKVGKTSASDSRAGDDYRREDETHFRFGDEARKKRMVYEYWGNIDINEDGIAEPMVITWIDDICIRMQENPYPDGKPPFLIVPFNSIPFQMYGEANAELLSDSQKVKTAILRGFIDNMAKSNNGQTGIRVGAMDGLNNKRFKNGDNFEFNGSTTDIWQGGYNAIPASAFNVYELMNADIESMTGTKNFGGGLNAGSLGGTATGARGVLDATSTRRLNLVRNISEKLIKPLMRKWMAYNSEYLEDEQVIRITNEEFIQIKKDDLEGLIDIDISVSTSEDNAAKAQELAFMLQTGQQTMDQGEVRMIRAEIARLQKMPALAKQIEEYQPQPDPMAEQEAQLRIALLEAQVQNERAKAKENEIDYELKSAKTANELAKAGKTSSERDSIDQDYLKKEYGMDKDEEMEKKQIDHMYKMEQEGMKQRNSGQRQ